MTTTAIQRYTPRSPLYRDLVETQTYLHKLQAETIRLSEHFDAWKRHRRSTIETVDGLQKRIDAVCVGCNVAKGVGAVAGIGGAIAGLVGLFLDANEDHETAENFYKASKFCAGAGIATVLTSTLLELGLTQSAINEIKRILQKDIELTKPLRNWIQFSHDIDYRFNHLFKWNIVSDTFISVLKVCRHCIKLLDSGIVSIQGLIRDLSHLKMEGIEDLTMEISDKVIHFLNRILTNPELRQPLIEIWKILNDTPYTFELAKVGATIYFETIGLLKSETNIAMLLSTVGIRLPTVPVPHCALNVISLASNVVTLILAVKNIQEGTSKYSESLDGIKMVLSCELREVSKQLRIRPLTLKSESDLELCCAKMAIL